MPYMSRIWLKFGFELPKDLVLELAVKHSICPEHILWHAMGIWLRIHFSGQRLMHRLRSTIIFPKMLRLKCQFENLPEMYIILLFTHKYQLSNNKINDHPQPWTYVYKETSYQSRKMSTWQISCTQKGVLRKMTLEVQKVEVK